MAVLVLVLGAVVVVVYALGFLLFVCNVSLLVLFSLFCFVYPINHYNQAGVLMNHDQVFVRVEQGANRCSNRVVGLVVHAAAFSQLLGIQNNHQTKTETFGFLCPVTGTVQHLRTMKSTHQCE